MAEPIEQIGSGIGAGFKGLGGLLGLGTEPLPDEQEAPDPDDMAARREAERRAARKYKGAGRSGTMLTKANNKLS